MPDSSEILNWPLSASTATAVESKEAKATTRNTPYQSHNGYKGYRERKHFLRCLVCFAVALFSVVLSVVLYVTVGVNAGKSVWIYRTWIVVSAGMAAVLMILTGSFFLTWEDARLGDHGGGGRTPLRALGREEIGTDQISVTRAHLLRRDREADGLTSPMTVLYGCDTIQSPRSGNTKPTSEVNENTAINARNMLSPASPTKTNDWPLRSSSTKTPPPRFPSPAKLRAAAAGGSDDVFYNGTERNVSPESAASVKAHDAKIKRGDSLKKLREATLRRKQAFETLK